MTYPIALLSIGMFICGVGCMGIAEAILCHTRSRPYRIINFLFMFLCGSGLVALSSVS